MNQLVPFEDMKNMAAVIAQSQFFGVKTPQEALALMLIAQAEGRHPASIAQEYSVIQGRPALKADAMLARYFAAGGKVEWVCMTDEKVTGKFSHDASGTVEITWDLKRAQQANLFIVDGKGFRVQVGKNGTSMSMYQKYPRQMLRARVISEGVRTSYPGIIGGMYTPEEVQDFEPKQAEAKIVTDAKEIEAEIPANLIVREPAKSMEKEAREKIKSLKWKAKEWDQFCVSLSKKAFKDMTEDEKEKAYAALCEVK